ncbi:hypothetical protein HanRHA438_Chr15g0735081 [Helianthus annuus]|nr:hypothetical protein HanRHA438_Chr15g0735081 [Helianthus annuus]
MNRRLSHAGKQPTIALRLSTTRIGKIGCGKGSVSSSPDEKSEEGTGTGELFWIKRSRNSSWRTLKATPRIP